MRSWAKGVGPVLAEPNLKTRYAKRRAFLALAAARARPLHHLNHSRGASPNRDPYIIRLNIALQMVISLYFGVEKATFQMGKVYLLRSPHGSSIQSWGLPLVHIKKTKKKHTRARKRPFFCVWISMRQTPDPAPLPAKKQKRFPPSCWLVVLEAPPVQRRRSPSKNTKKKEILRNKKREAPPSMFGGCFERGEDMEDRVPLFDYPRPDLNPELVHDPNRRTWFKSTLRSKRGSPLTPTPPPPHPPPTPLCPQDKRDFPAGSVAEPLYSPPSEEAPAPMPGFRCSTPPRRFRRLVRSNSV